MRPFPVKVLGVVFAVYDKKGREKWRLPLDIFPERLETSETVTPRGIFFPHPPVKEKRPKGPGPRSAQRWKSCLKYTTNGGMGQ